MPLIPGTSRNDSLTGFSTRDTLLGFAGNDTLNGNAGPDFLAGNEGFDSLLGGAGIDTLIGGSETDTLAGGFDGDSLQGNGGNDFLSGVEMEGSQIGTPANDSLIGGLDNDFYLLGNAGDRVTELSGEGLDTVVAGFDITLPAHVEELRINGAVGRAVTGNSQANRIVGSNGNDTLDGGVNASSLAIDTLIGGAGNDVYRLHRFDVVVERTGQGIDQIEAGFSLQTPEQIEGLRLLGTANLNGKTNAAGGGLLGNFGNNLLEGGPGNDRLAGNGGRDTLLGGDGSDMLFHHESALDHEVASFFPPGIFVDGGAQNDLIIGGQGGDTLIGGDGADWIVSGNGFTRSSENALGDALGCAAVNFFFGGFVGNVECGKDEDDEHTDNILFLVAVAFSDSVTGGSGDDVLAGDANSDTIRGGLDSDQIFGMAGNDLLFGELGNDTLDGRNGDDTMDGGEGDDTFFVDSTGDVVVESAGAGIDTIISTVDRTMRANPENLMLRGRAVTGGGNDLDNRMTGTRMDNFLNGAGGNDTLVGSDGSDRLKGNQGNDRLRGGGETMIEVDTLSGGAGRDVYVLGSASQTHYIKGGDEDYAMIRSFGSSDQDQLKLHGIASDYVVTGSRSGAKLFSDENANGRLDDRDDLIALAEGITAAGLFESVQQARFV